MDGRWIRPLLVAVVAITVLGWTHVLGSGISWLFLGGVTAATLSAWALWTLIQKLPDVHAAVRERFWAAEEGWHHAFAGVGLRIEDDGRYVWIDGQGLLRVLGRREADDVLAARLAGMWRRDAKGVLLLRVDAVIDYLAHMPERNDLRVQKLRRYLERDVLHPAAERRRRA